MIAIIDYLRFTIKSFPDWTANADDVIKMLLLLDREKFVEGKGMYGYKARLSYEGISVFYDGNEDMGICVQMGGSACRWYENIQAGYEWLDLFRVLVLYRCKITRLDIAIDDYEILDIDKMLEYIVTGRILTYFREYGQIDKKSIQKGNKTSDTLYFGSRTSDCMFRVYDKYLEQVSKGLECPYDKWVRFELELKNRRAENFINALLSPENFGNIGFVAVKVINRYMRFIEIDESIKNKSRMPFADWWLEFITTCEKLQIAKGDIKNDVEKVFRWLQRSVANSLKLVKECYGSMALENMINNAVLTEKQTVMKKKYMEVM